MGKLFKVREWLTLEGAAKHLTAVCEEEVSVADLLQLALERKLTLSVNLVNHARAKLGKVVRFDEVPRRELPSLDGKDVLQFVDGMILETGDPVTANSPTVTFDDEVFSIEGVWDLAMLGGEKIDIEHQFQQLTGGPDVELVSLDGSFLKRPDGSWASLQESLAEALGAPKPRELKRVEYYPAGGLPDDAPLVVRKEALLDFEQFLLDEHGRTPNLPDEKPLETKERNSLLAIIGLLADQCSLDLHTPSKTAQVMESAANLKGIKLASRTIAEHLKKVPQAMEHLSR